MFTESFVDMRESTITIYFPACNCPGPIKYYEEIRCTPIFKNEGDCCPERYNCDHLKNLPNDKCVLYGHEYDIGQFIKAEDSRPCDGDCICTLSKQG